MRKIYFFFIIFTIFSCQNKSEKNLEFKSYYTGKYSNQFEILNNDEYQILRVSNEHYLLLKEGQKAPKELQGYPVVHIPVKSIVPTSSTFIPFIDILNENNSIIGFPGINYISVKLDNEKEIVDLGQEQLLNIESLLHLNPEVYLSYNFGSDNERDALIKKAGITVIYNNDWQENQPLARAEWIIFYGALYNKIDQAKSIFNDIESNYNRLKKAQIDSNKTVISGAVFNGVWYSPAGNSFLAQLYRDAGLNYIYSNSNGTGSLSLDPEAVFNDAREVKYWFNPDANASLEELQSQSKIYREFDAFKSQNIYGYGRKKGAHDALIFFDLSGLHPDWLLNDFLYWTSYDKTPYHSPFLIDKLPKID